MSKVEQIVMYDAPDAVELVIVTGYKSKDGRFYGKDESLARYASCTHKRCECGEITKKHYTKCEACRSKQATERYQKMPHKDWDGEPVVLHDGDRYFSSEDDLADWCAVENIEPDKLQLVICEPNIMRGIDYDDHYCDDLPEGMGVADMLPDIAAAFDELNKKIAEAKPILSWCGGKYRTTWNPSDKVRAEIKEYNAEQPHE